MLYAPLAEALAIAGDRCAASSSARGLAATPGCASPSLQRKVLPSRATFPCAAAGVHRRSWCAEHIVIGDARRGLFHGTHVRDGFVVDSMVVVDDAAMRAWLAERNGLPCFTSDANSPSVHPDAQWVSPSAMLLARHALAHSGAQDLIEPLYVQEAFISKARKVTTRRVAASQPEAPSTASRCRGGSSSGWGAASVRLHHAVDNLFVLVDVDAACAVDERSRRA